jgi:tight adherence protein C
MLILIIIMAFLSCFTICYSILVYIQRSRLAVYSRLEGIQQYNSSNDNTEMNQSLFLRVFRPMLDTLEKAIMKMTPGELTTSLERKVTKAGNPGNLAVKDWVNLQAVLAAGLPAVTLLTGRSFNVKLSGLLLWIILEVATGLVLPGFVLGKMATARQKLILNSLPDVMDLLTVSVEAGLGFDGALLKVVDKKPGPLAAEFEKVLQEIKVGRQKKDALRDMAQRVDIQDLTAFVSSIIQADQFGVGIANVLRIQAVQMRQKRRQRAQEKAMKAPIKMLIPMVIFIFPTLFIVLLGPVVIQLIEQMGK